MPTVREFIDFWTENSVHADEQFAPRRDEEALRLLAARLIAAAEEQGFTAQQINDEVGEPLTYVSGIVRERNADDTERLAQGK